MHFNLPGLPIDLSNALDVQSGGGWIRFYVGKSFAEDAANKKVLDRAVDLVRLRIGSRFVTSEPDYLNFQYKPEIMWQANTCYDGFRSQLLFEKHLASSPSSKSAITTQFSNRDISVKASSTSYYATLPSLTPFEAEFYADGRRRSARLAAASRLTSSSSPIQLSPFCSVFHRDNPKARHLFIYPEDAPDGILITENEVSRLNPRIYLNDTLVDLDMRSTWEKMPREMRSLAHFFNSFFYFKLCGSAAASTAAASADAAARKNNSEEDLPVDYDAVKRWTLGTDIFKLDYLIVPICENLHWYLAIVCHPWAILPSEADALGGGEEQPVLEVESGAEDARQATKEGEDECKFLGEIVKRPACTILLYDSLGASRQLVADRLAAYLVREAAEKLEIGALADRIQSCTLRGPLQPNLYDCGLFMLQAIEAFFADTQKVLDQIQHSPSRQQQPLTIQLESWFESLAAMRRRSELRMFIERLRREHAIKGTLLCGNSQDRQTISDDEDREAGSLLSSSSDLEILSGPPPPPQQPTAQ